MAGIRARFSRWGYIAAVFLVAFLVGSWFAVENVAGKGYVEAASRTRSLQVELARTAMETSFLERVTQLGILAAYTFPEYLQSRRTTTSVRGLLDLELATYPDVMGYAYYETPARSSLVALRPGMEGIRASLDAASPSMWNLLGSFEGPIVQAGKSGLLGSYFLVFFPVRVSAERRALLGVAIGLENAIVKYLRPLQPSSGRLVYLLASEAGVLWPSGSIPLALGSDLPPPYVFRTARSFSLGSTLFTIEEADTAASLREDFSRYDKVRLIVLLVDILLIGLTVWSGLALYSAELRRDRLSVQKKALKVQVSRTEEELSRSEERFEAVFDASFEALAIINAEGNILRVNGRAEDLFGRPAAEFIGRKPSEFAPPTQPDGRPSTVVTRELYARAAAGEKPSWEWRYLRADGKARMAEVGLSAMTFGLEPAVVISIRDITARKAAELSLRSALEDREILLRELHHRVKNNLQLLDSLIELQKERVEPGAQAALATTQSRIAALAASYLVVADTPDALQIDTAAYLARVCVQLRYEARELGLPFTYELAADAIPLSLDKAVPLGLVLRELLNNAIVHGGVADLGTGAVVAFHCEGGRAALRVSDHGPGPKAELADGLGLTIVRALVHQLGGTFEYGDAGPGFFALASFPLT